MSNKYSIEHLRRLIAEQTRQLEQATKDLNAAVAAGREHDAARRLQAAADNSSAARQEELRRTRALEGRLHRGARFIEIREQLEEGNRTAGEGDER